MKTLVTEWCPFCSFENTIEWDIENEGMKAYCPHCGKPLLLCSMCEQTEECDGRICPYVNNNN